MRYEKVTAKDIDTKIMKLQLISAPAMILLGLGLYGVFGVTDGNAFHPALNDKNNAYGLIAVGVAIEVFFTMKLVQLLKQKAELVKEQ